MDSILNQDESYADRRRLFKNIWDTAMTMDEKETTDVLTKPKVIKTLRLDEVDRCMVGKKKKQRLKNLRAVCNKLLDFCDRQDADDLFYEQMAAEGKDVLVCDPDLVKKPKAKVKRKVIKSKSVFSRVTKPTVPTATTSERQGDIDRNVNIAPSRNKSPITKRSFTFKTHLSNHHKLRRVEEGGKITHRKVVTKNISKRIRSPKQDSARIGKLKCNINVTRAVADGPKKLLEIRKINI